MANLEKQFSTTGVNTGGRNGQSYVEGKDFSVDIVAPNSKREGTNPEELFALGYSACFHSALDAVKSQEDIQNKSVVRNTVTLYQEPNEVNFQLGVEIEVGIEGIDLNKAQTLADKAHKVCPYSKAVENGQIKVEVKAVEYQPAD